MSRDQNRGQPFRFFSHRSLDLGFQKSLAASEPNERNRPEFKTRNPGKGSFKEEKEEKDEKEKRIVLKIALFLL